MWWDHPLLWSLVISRSLAWSPSKCPCAYTKPPRVPRGHACSSAGVLHDAWQGQASLAWAAGGWVHPELQAGWCLPVGKLFQLFQIPPTHTQSPCFVIKTRRKSHPKEFYLFLPLLIPVKLSFLKKKQHPQNWPAEQQTSQDAHLITSFFKIHLALHTNRFQKQSYIIQYFIIFLKASLHFSLHIDNVFPLREMQRIVQNFQ